MELPRHVEKTLDKIEKSSRVLIVGHHDADGASSAGVLYRALMHLGKEVDIILLRQFYPEALQDIPHADYDFLIFVDLAGSYATLIRSRVGEEFFIVDHHDQNELNSPYLFHPKHMGYNPDSEASSSTLSALLAYQMTKDPKLLVYGLVGAVGDNQVGPEGFYGLNEVFLVRSIKRGVVTVYRDLILPGIKVKDLSWLLAYSEPPLPGLTGNPKEVYDLLERAGIGDRVKYHELSLDQKKRFFTALALYLMKQGWGPEKVRSLIGKVYEINGNIGWMSTIRSFKSLVNGVAKRLRSDLVGPLFVDDLSALPEAEKEYYAYKKEIVTALRRARRKAADMGSWVFVDGRGIVPEYATGFVASVVASEMKKPTVVVTYTGDGQIKGSIRGGKNLSRLIGKMSLELGMEGGGHSEAAGFRALEEKLEDLISYLSKEFETGLFSPPQNFSPLLRR